MILEGIVTTVGEGGRVNISPMGPSLGADLSTLILRPFKSSQTYKNLKAHGEGVFHVTDDVEMLARSAVGEVTPELKRAREVNGWIIASACRAFELRVRSVDETSDRASFVADVVREETLREFLGFNRAKHAVLEAAILATRVHLLPRAEILEKLEDLAVLVQKTGGSPEERAFAYLRAYIAQAPRSAPRSVRVRAGSRLHFGLIWPGEGGPRRFGGAGAMVQDPGVEIEAAIAETTCADGPLADRALAFARACGGERFPVSIRVLSAPPGHSGLGTGTQLGLAVARSISVLRGESPSVDEIAQRVERGRRSAIGVHGFRLGGFLVDGGRSESSRLAPLLIRLEVPENWRFVLAAPASGTGLSGAEEEATFHRLDVADQGAARLSAMPSSWGWLRPSPRGT